MMLITAFTLITVVITTLADEANPDYHRSFNKQELAEIFGVHHDNQVPKYSSTKVHGLQTPKEDTQHSLSLKAFGKNLNIKTTVNRNFIADTHTTEFVDGYGNITKYVGVLGVYSFGEIENDPDSHVALYHTAKGVSGSIRTSNDLYLINPLPYRLKNEKDNHIIFRASDIPGDHIIKTPFKEDDDEYTDTVKVQRRRRRSTTNQPKKTIELLIAADWKMLEFYGEDVLPSYMLAVANVMAGFFRDASLSYPMDIVVVRSTIFKTNILQAKDIDNLLSKFSVWCNENNNLDENSEEHFDAALLFTKSGCDDGCKLEGLAYTNVPCNFGKAQGVGKDRGFMSAITLSHELGHTLNAGHDGSAICPDGINIMATGGIGGGPEALKWSKCSSQQFEETLRSSRSSCFDDLPPKTKTDSTFQLYGTVYDATKQCQFMMGDNYQKCSPYEHRCDSLFCNPIGANACETIYFPALHGTYCEKNKWCIDGACVPDGTLPPQPINGGWSAWSSYTDCNKQCDIGVQWQVRHCNNPEPTNGGDWCDKNALRKIPELGNFKTCNTNKCKGTQFIKDRYYTDRDEQCEAIKPGSTFCSYCRGIGPCSLYCGGPTYGTLQGYARSGTYCRTDGIHSGVCVHGNCVEIGCDYKLNSGRLEDRCGICNGDGSPCQPMKGEDNTRFKNEGRRGHFFITTIPVNATKVIVQEGGKTMNFLTCKVGDSNDFAIPLRSYGINVQLDGAIIRYKLNSFPHQDTIYIDGVLKVPVHIYYSNYYYYGASAGVHWSYTIVGVGPPAGRVEVHWVPDPWSYCSKSCAGGFQTRDIVCRRKDDNTSATIELCQMIDQAKPVNKTECQTQNCPAIWYISEWSACTKSCATGQRTRTITCAELTKAGTFETVEESKCASLTKPPVPTTELCNDVTCPAHWEVLTPFSDCSQSCEGGFATREVGCRRLEKNSTLIVVSELECIGINKTIKPETRKECNTDIPCPRWLVEYSECSATCGAGVRQPNVICSEGGTEKKKLPFEECDQSLKPVTSSLTLKDCNMGECAGHKWGTREGSCSTTCGEGVITSSAYCYEIVTSREVEDFRCPALEKPTVPGPKACNPGICEDVYVWKNDLYGACSTTCGEGVQLTEPYCVQLKTNAVVSTLTCDAGTKPTPLSKPCNPAACPLYDWTLTYSDCSVTCGKGVAVGSAACKRLADGAIVDISLCSGTPGKPTDVSRECELAVCPDPASYHWKLTKVGCNVTCGRGMVVKELVCYRKDSEMKYTKVSPHHCVANPEPPMVEEECVLDPCPATHQWNKMGQYCAIGCGKGYNVVELNCTEIKTNDVADRKHCTALDTPTPDCTRDCTPLPMTVDPSVYTLGCYKDNLYDRKVPLFYNNYRDSYNKSNPFATIKKCYEGARSRNFVFFALQFYGECWIGDNNTMMTYDGDGPSNQCSAGTGSQQTNFVYHIGSPIPTTNVYVVKLGCRIVPNTSTSSASSRFALLRVVSLCGPAAFKQNHNYFGGDNAGNCLTKEAVDATIASSSFSNTCLPDTKGMTQYHVYVFVKK